LRNCSNCGHEISDRTTICPECGATSTRNPNSGAEEGWAIGCTPLVIAGLDVIGMPLAGIVILSAAPSLNPVWIIVLYLLLQSALLVWFIDVYRSSAAGGIGPRTRVYLLIGTIVAALLLGLGTACNMAILLNPMSQL